MEVENNKMQGFAGHFIAFLMLGCPVCNSKMQEEGMVLYNLDF